MAAESAARSFMATPKFAVVGASSDPSKFGHKILAWYLERSLPVTPINPTNATIKVAAKEYPAVKSVGEIKEPSGTAVSIITPPKVTINVLKEAKEKGVQSVWLQPGTFNDEVMEYAHANFKNVIGGDGGMGSEGWCVLVDGDKAIQGREKLDAKL